MTKKTTKTNKAWKTLLIALILAMPIVISAPSFDSVTFSNPVEFDAVQTFTAQITSNYSIISVLIELDNSNFTMSLVDGAFAYSYSPQAVGTISFSIYAQDNQSQTTKYQNSFQTINSSLPSILTKAPTGEINTESVELRITTNQSTDCKYDISQETYGDMGDFFENTGGTTHTQLLTHLSSGEKTYYVACKNLAQKVRYDNVSFEVNLPPTAQIELSKDSPLSADTYRVTIYTSKPLSGIPTLKYKYDDDQTYHDISLVGNDDRWTAYLVIPDTEDDRVGKFYFSGTDYDALTGTKITSGERFIVDTSKPPAPVSIDGIIDDDKIMISWFYDGEEADKFNVYRSSTPGVEYVDYHDDERDESFSDYNLDDKEKYYYKVAAVDKAGNIGELSDEVYLLFEEKGNYDEEAKVVSLDDSLEKELNQTYNEYRTLKFDAEFAISELEKETDRFKTQIISELRVIENAESASKNIDNILSELDGMRSQDLGKSQFNSKISNIEIKIDKIKRDIITEITIVDSLEYTQSTSDAAISKTIEEVLNNKDMEEDVKSNYTITALAFQDQSNVFTTIIISKFKSLDNHEEFVTSVTKEFTISEDAYNAILVETIPKTFSQSSNDITFLKNPKILSDDPVVYWEYSRISEEKITYFVSEKRQLDDVKDASMVILPNPSKFGPKRGVYLNEKDENKITGNAVSGKTVVFGVKEFVFLSLGVFIIAGLLVYYFFFLKGDNEIREDNRDLHESIPNPFRIIDNKEIHEDSLIQISDQNEKLGSMILDAENSASKLDFDTAKKGYREIFGLFKEADFKGIAEKNAFVKKIRRLHSLISIKKNLDDALEFTSKKDYDGLKTVVEELKKISFSMIGHDHSMTLLKNYVGDYYEYYLKILSKIKNK